MNHILVDYENLKSVEPAVFELEGATWTLLLGPQNRTLSVSVVQQLMARAASVELVRLEQAGRNAVDFALAYYLGRKVLGDPAATFHVISKDTGYQPLVEHLQSRNVRIARHESFEAFSCGARAQRKATGHAGTKAGSAEEKSDLRASRDGACIRAGHRTRRAGGGPSAAHREESPGAQGDTDSPDHYSTG